MLSLKKIIFVWVVALIVGSTCFAIEWKSEDKGG